MIQISKRWPILAGLVAAVGYAANHFEIAGTEHLRLETRTSSPPSTLSDYAPQYPPRANAFQGEGPLEQNWNNSGPLSELLASSSQFSDGANLPWKDALSAGEKLNLIVENMQEHKLAKTQQAPSLPLPDPIPLDPNRLTVPTQLAPAYAGSANQLPGTTPGDSLPNHYVAKETTPESENYQSTNAGSLQPARDSLAPIEDDVSQYGIAQSYPTTQVQSPVMRIKPNPLAEPSNSALTSKNIRAGTRIRVATLNTSGLGPTKLSRPRVVERLVMILRQFDLIAVQAIASDRNDILPLLLERLNQSGRKFDFLIGPRVGRERRLQLAFIFDTDNLETDRFQLYTVDDPDDLMTFEPLVGWFRCKSVRAEDAFTFSAVNVSIEASAAKRERAVLPNLMKAVQADGRLEDDCILLGDFSSSSSELLATMGSSQYRFAVQDVPTNVEGSVMGVNLIFPANATMEFSGRSGTFDFLRQYNLSLEQAVEISEHLPVWAEFSTTEGGAPGQVAPPALTPVF